MINGSTLHFSFAENRYFKVIATDLDSNENGHVTYSIIKGDSGNQFSIDPETGYISVGDYLDRETISNYVLEVLAKDNGIPVLSGQALVNIEITDANDNPPLFSQSNYTTVVQVICHIIFYNLANILF